MLSIQTNVNSLNAQQNLSTNSQFMSRTIQQLTSGYRINSSGDDAAGLAVANQIRDNISQVTQGVANGNNGVAQLQIMDGGISNLSQILDGMQTLAAESASSSFTGDRTVLNNEFQTDISEINRQAQAIGLNTGGTFAQNMAVYLGGGQGGPPSARRPRQPVRRASLQRYCERQPGQFYRRRPKPRAERRASHKQHGLRLGLVERHQRSEHRSGQWQPDNFLAYVHGSGIRRYQWNRRQREPERRSECDGPGKQHQLRHSNCGPGGDRRRGRVQGGKHHCVCGDEFGRSAGTRF